MYKIFVVGVLGGSIVLGSPVQAIDFVKESVPGKWVERLAPEDLPDLEYPSYFDHLDKARAQMMGGRYKLSLVTLNKAKDADVAEAALVRGSSLASLGRAEDALKTLSQPKVVDEPRAQIARAHLLAASGRTDEALSLLSKHLQDHPDSIAGHFEFGQINEQVGDLDAAKRAYRWFVDDQQLLDKWQGQNSDIFDSAANVTIIGRALDRWAQLTGAYQTETGLHDILLNMFVKAYDVIDRGYLPAHVAAAEYFLSHDQRAEAVKELEAALEANPRDIVALRLMGEVALATFNFDGLDNLIAEMRDVDSDSIVAELLEVRNLLQQRRPKDAFSPLERVLKKQPKNIEALGLLASAHALRLEDDKAAEVLKQVEKLDPDNATAHYELAEHLGAMRQYPRSAEQYKIAIERAPWWTAPRNGLGLLYTQSGDEDEARVTLDAAHALDPFNLATTNYLRLLEDLGKFARSETAHFIVFYDAQSDPLIPEYFSEYLESIYADVCAQFKHEPKVKTLIEVFPTHDAFSVRTTGSPWIGTVGASTGRVIALVSPRKGKQTMGSFNWANVLRHEFTHTVTLSATDNRIAHWMTEGLAVLEERSPLPWQWVPMLYQAVSKDQLFTMEGLTWGFIRPRKPSDRQLAYAQSFWICKYIDQKYGRAAILKMLDQFRAGRSQEEVFPDVIGRDLAQFSTDFNAWAKEQVAGWGYDKETSERVKKLREEAQELLDAGQQEKSLPLWEEIAKLRPVDQLPHMRLASIYMKLGRSDAAAQHLLALHAAELKDNRYAKAVARIYRDSGKTEDAVKYAQQSVYIDPYDESAHELLADIFEKTGNETGLSREKRVIAMLAEWKKLQTEQEKAPADDSLPALPE